MPDVGYDEEQRSYAQTISSFCAKNADAWTPVGETAELAPALWSALGELGVLGLASADSGAQPLDLVAAHEALGAGGCIGPLWATTLVVGASTGPEVDAISAGQLVVSVGSLARMPWARRADLLFDIDGLGANGGRLRRCESVEIVRETVLIGFEPAGELRCSFGADLVVSARAKDLAELALAAYLAGAARRLITDVAAYVRVRRQFGRPLSQFQAVAHPLAECDARVGAAAALVRRAASRVGDVAASVGAEDGDVVDRADLVETSLALASAARAARQTVYQAHQAYGGIGFAVEGPLSWLGSRVAQLSTEAEALCRARPVSDLIGNI